LKPPKCVLGKDKKLLDIYGYRDPKKGKGKLFIFIFIPNSTRGKKTGKSIFLKIRLVLPRRGTERAKWERIEKKRKTKNRFLKKVWGRGEWPLRIFSRVCRFFQPYFS